MLGTAAALTRPTSAIRRPGSSIKKPSTLNQPADVFPAGLQAWYHGVKRVWCLDESHQKERLFRFYTAPHCALVTEICNVIDAPVHHRI